MTGAQEPCFYYHFSSQIGRACLEHILPPERAEPSEDPGLLHPVALLSAGDEMQLSLAGAI